MPHRRTILIISITLSLAALAIGARLDGTTRPETPISAPAVDAAAASQPATPLRHHGICWVSGPRITEVELSPLRDLGVEWIAQTPFGWQGGVDTPEIGFSGTRGGNWGESDVGIRTTTTLARELGIHTLLKPHLWMHSRNGLWRGDIRMKSEADWQTWFANYKKFILHYARVAEESNIEIFCVGSELHMTTRHRPDDWRAIIAAVREVYSGKLTYGANWYREYEEIPFWDDLDYIGIHAYFPLSEADDPTYADLMAGWHPHVRAIERVQRKFDKPVLFTEIGYRSAPIAAARPWEWPRWRGGGTVDHALQADCYRAFFATFWSKPWCAGVYWWKWYPRQRRGRGPDNDDFTPQKKPAEKVLAEFYGAAE